MKKAKTPQYETLISVVILLILCCVAMAVILPQFSSQPMPQTTQPGSENLENILSGLKPADFTAISKLETYDADTLYEKIDGKAPLYTDSGFEKLFTRQFRDNSKDDQTFELYVYDMGSPKNALAVYSQQKREDVQTISGVDFGYQTTNAIFYSLGKYYLEIIGSAQSPELLKSMATLVEQLKTALPPTQSLATEEMQLLQKTGPEAGSIKFYIDSAFGCKELTNVFSVVIKTDNKPVTIFISKRADEKEASSLVSTYSKFLTGLGAKEKKIDLPAPTGVAFEFLALLRLFSAKVSSSAESTEPPMTRLLRKRQKSSMKFLMKPESKYVRTGKN